MLEGTRESGLLFAHIRENVPFGEVSMVSADGGRVVYGWHGLDGDRVVASQSRKQTREPFACRSIVARRWKAAHPTSLRRQ